MSDATCTGLALSIPCLALIGVDPVAIGFGFVGAIVAETLLRDRENKVDRAVTMAVMVGATLVAGVATPAISLYIGGESFPTKYHALLAMLIGAFAQPMMVWLKVGIRTYGGKMLEKIADRILGGRNGA